METFLIGICLFCFIWGIALVIICIAGAFNDDI